jgi:hypothetical protein
MALRPILPLKRFDKLRDPHLTLLEQTVQRSDFQFAVHWHDAPAVAAAHDKMTPALADGDEP